MGNGKLGSGNPGRFANTTVILLFIWNVDMQLLYIKLLAVVYATLLNFQSPFFCFSNNTDTTLLHWANVLSETYSAIRCWGIAFTT